MAITRTQIAKQLLSKGGRIGLKGGADAATASFGKSAGYSGPDGSTGRPDKDFNIDSQGNVSFTPSGSGKDSKAPPPKPPITKDNFQKPNKFVTPTMAVLNFLGNKFSGSKLAMLNNKMQRNNYLATLTPEEQVEALTDLAAIGIGTDNPMGIDRNIERGMENRGLFGTGIGGGEFITDIDVGGPEAKAVLGEGYTNYQKEQRERFTPDDKDGPQDPCKGPNPPAYCFVGIRSVEPEVEDDDEIINYRLMNKGGRVNLFKGAQADASAGKGAMSPGTDTGGGFRGGNGDGPKGPPTTGGGDGPKFDIFNPIDSIKAQLASFAGLKPEDIAKAKSLEDDDDENTNAIDTVFSEKPAADLQTVYGTGLSKRRQIEKNILDSMADGGRAGLAGGGMPYEGGIMDLESARQMYGLGKLVKKIGRSVKKIAKSPIGKAALAFGAYKLGGGFLKNKGIMGSLFGQAGSRVGQSYVPFKEGILAKLGLTKGGGSMMPTFLGGLAASTLGSYFLTPKEEDEDETLYAGADIADPSYIMNNPELFTNRRLAAEGGDIEKEPVAKKVMPLLDMDGKEKDYRETGGFVDMGRMEKADDVPARLSKNEFVFTADAVRNAGDGSVDKGAEVMYNMMKNLEAGGDVSEESQGLEGARKMFQTSQRLEEVL